MAKQEVGVFIMPVVLDDLSRYVDGFGNKRYRDEYNIDDLPVTNVKEIPTLGSLSKPTSSVTFRAFVKSEFLRDPNNSTGVPKNVKSKRGVLRKVRKPSAPLRHINYLVTVKFLGLTFTGSESLTQNKKIVIGKNVYYSNTPTIKNNKVMLKCQCRDFGLVWEKPLAENGGLWPNNVWTKYQRLTPVSDQYPLRNPDNRMGYCKHIESFLQYLVANNKITNGKSI